MNAIEWVNELQKTPRKPGQTSMSVLRSRFKHTFVIITPAEKKAAQEWLKEFPSEDYVALPASFHIRDEMIALQFKLMFSDHLK